MIKTIEKLLKNLCTKYNHNLMIKRFKLFKLLEIRKENQQ